MHVFRTFRLAAADDDAHTSGVASRIVSHTYERGRRDEGTKGRGALHKDSVCEERVKVTLLPFPSAPTGHAFPTYRHNILPVTLTTDFSTPCDTRNVTSPPIVDSNLIGTSTFCT